MIVLQVLKDVWCVHVHVESISPYLLQIDKKYQIPFEENCLVLALLAFKSRSVSFFYLLCALHPSSTFIRVKIVLAGGYFTDTFQVHCVIQKLSRRILG
jgi:hypothetical protein